MKRFIVFCLFLLSALMVSGMDFQSSMDYSSAYVFRGERLVGTPCLSPSVGFASDNFEFNLKSFYNMERKENFKGEYMLSLKTDVKEFDLRVGLLHHDMIKVDHRDTTEFFMKATWNGRWSPFVAVYMDFVKGSGKYFQFGIDKQLLKEKGALVFGAHFGYVVNNELMGVTNAGQQFSGFYDGEVSLKTTINLSKYFKAYPFVAYTFPLSKHGENAIEQLSAKQSENTLYGGVKIDFVF